MFIRDLHNTKTLLNTQYARMWLVLLEHFYSKGFEVIERNISDGI